MASLKQGGAAQPLEPVALMGLTGDAGVKGKALAVGGERFGRGVGPGQGWVLQGESSAAGKRCGA